MKKIFVNLTLILLLSGILTAQNITKGPYLANPGTSEMTIRWESSSSDINSLHFGEKDSQKLSIKSVMIGSSHENYLFEVNLINLKPATVYNYTINNKKQYSFKTSPPAGNKIKFVVMGDSRSNPGIFTDIIGAVDDTNPDLIICTGDMVADGGNYSEWHEYYFSVAQQVIDHIPLISTLGDHEGSGDNGALFKYFLFPDKELEKLWFSYDYGDAHFVSLDYRNPDDPEMIAWFEEDMQKTKAKWVFVYMHRPCYNLGGHRSLWGNPHWPELFRKYKVDMVFAGHSHLYERFFPVRPSAEPDSWPVTYITTGGAGASLYEVVSHPLLAFSKSINHFLSVELTGNKLRLLAITNDGTVMDSVIIKKGDGAYNDKYLSTIQSQEELEIVNTLASAISFSMDRVPLKTKPAQYNIRIGPIPVSTDIYFKISLTDESKTKYRMKSVSDTLFIGQSLAIPVDLYSDTAMKLSNWGAISPPLRLQVYYKTNKITGQIIGNLLRYRHY